MKTSQIVPPQNRHAGRAAEAAPYQPICAMFRRYLHGNGEKFTPQRAMILNAVLQRDGLFAAEDLADALKDLGHRASRASVYRTLALLQEAGICRQIFFDNKQSYFEVIAGRPSHDYLVCVETGRVIEFSSDRLRELRDAIALEHGFEVLNHQFHIMGLSPAAQAKDRTVKGA